MKNAVRLTKKREGISVKMVYSDRMFAVAVRDGDELFLWIRLRRAAGTDIYYVVPTGREDERDWKKWNPHGSWQGTYNLITRGLASDEPRAFGVLCDPTKFSEIMEVPVEILSPKHYETYTSVDVSEPGLQPMLMGGGEEIPLQRVFDDAIPHITVTVYKWQSAG
jgi:hypothetical protein